MRAVKRRFAGALATAAAVAGTVLALPAPAHAAWGTTDNITLQAYGTNAYGVVTNVGSATGWVQFDDGGNTFRYSLTVCRQSGYVNPYLSIGVNASYWQGHWTDTHLDYVYTNPSTPGLCSYGYGDTVTGTETASKPWSVNFTLVGGYFNGSTNTFSNVTDNEVVTNPYH